MLFELWYDNNLGGSEAFLEDGQGGPHFNLFSICIIVSHMCYCMVKQSCLYILSYCLIYLLNLVSSCEKNMHDIPYIYSMFYLAELVFGFLWEHIVILCRENCVDFRGV